MRCRKLNREGQTRLEQYVSTHFKYLQTNTKLDTWGEEDGHNHTEFFTQLKDIRVLLHCEHHSAPHISILARIEWHVYVIVGDGVGTEVVKCECCAAVVPKGTLNSETETTIRVLPILVTLMLLTWLCLKHCCDTNTLRSLEKQCPLYHIEAKYSDLFNVSRT